MRFFLKSLLVAAALMFPAVTLANPVQFDDPKWASFFSNSSERTLPDGIPMGKGAIHKWDGKHFLDGELYQVNDPYDLSTRGEFIFSDFAVQYGNVFSSETAKAFLWSVVREARSLTGNPQLRIPIQRAYSPRSSLPMPNDTEHVMGVQIGAIIGSAGQQISNPNRLWIGRNEDFEQAKIRDLRHYKLYRQYAMVLDDMKASSSQNIEDVIKKAYRDAKSQVAKQMEWERDNATEKIERERNDRRLTESQRIRFGEDKRRADIAAWHAAYTQEETETDWLNTWLIIEAALTQTAAEVIEIQMPVNIRAQFIKTATEAGRPDSVTKRFDEITVPADFGITFILACSVRDRFLGCALGGNGKTEEEVAQKASQIIRAAKHLKSAERQLKALTLVANANPLYLDEPIDVWNLYERLKKNKDLNLKPLVEVSKIPIRKAGKLYYPTPEQILDLGEAAKTDRRDGRPSDHAAALPF